MGSSLPHFTWFKWKPFKDHSDQAAAPANLFQGINGLNNLFMSFLWVFTNGKRAIVRLSRPTEISHQREFQSTSFFFFFFFFAFCIFLLSYFCIFVCVISKNVNR